MDEIRVPTATATPQQLLTHLTRKVTAMSQQIDRLNAAVDRELADDTAQQQLITDLRTQLATARAAADQAATGETQARETMQAALDAADAAAARLEANDAPQAPADPTPAPDAPAPDAPAAPSDLPAPDTTVEPTPDTAA